MNKFRKSDWALLFIILATFGVGVVLYPDLPEQIPTHWGFDGEVNDYSDKLFAIFLFPGISLAMFFGFILFPKIDPRKENYENFSKAYAIFRWTIHIFFSAIYLLTLYYSLDPLSVPWYLEISFVIPIFVSILFIVLGNYFGQIQDNFFIGFRTPWTLSNKEVWYKTHRLAGKLYVISGLIGIVGSLLPNPFKFILLLVPILFSSIYIVIYSYIEYKKHKAK